jgi:hypothetical protein
MKAGLAFTGRTHVSTLYESIYHDCGIDDAEADEQPRRHTVDKVWSGCGQGQSRITIPYKPPLNDLARSVPEGPQSRIRLYV